MLATAAVYREEAGEATVFVMNTELEEPVLLKIGLESFGGATLLAHECLRHPDLNAVNTFENPDEVTPGFLPVEGRNMRSFELPIPPASWNVLRFRV